MSALADAGAITGGLFVGGEWRAGADTYVCVNPARPHEEIGRFAIAGPPDVDDAYEAAADAARAWARTSPVERGEVLHRAAALVEERLDPLARDLSREMGKCVRDARGEVLRSVAILRYFAGRCSDAIGNVYPSANTHAFLHTVTEPLGVVCVITPWNFPLAIPAWKIAPALACGNAVVWKPAEIVPRSALNLVEALHEAGLPGGALNLLTGPSAALGTSLYEHPAPRAVSFTGSNAVGARIRDGVAPRGVKLQLELGGSNPAVVMPEADLDQAARMIARGAMLSTGQRCTATRRLIAHRDCVGALVPRVVAAVEAMRLGDPLDEATDIGPLASRAQYEHVLSYLDLAARERLTVATGGAALDGPGHFVAPTVYVDVPRDSRLSRDEVFGPVLAVSEASSLQDAIGVANDTDFGLSATIFTRDLGDAFAFARDAQAGVVHVNDETTGAEPHVPFGGHKASGAHWREQGRAALAFYSKEKTVYMGMP